MRILETSLAQPWAILPERIDGLVEIALRENAVTPEALAAYRAKADLTGEKFTVRNDVAIIKVIGPLFKRANLFTAMSGATSYEITRRDLQAALDSPDISAILFEIDSPGGEANGCDELAKAIFNARGKKKIAAYVSGMAASAAYWIAAAAERVVVSDNAILGSIGIVIGMKDESAREERAGIKSFQFVSSQSPGKRSDPNTDIGKARLQKMVDDLAVVFIAAVAKYRGVSAKDVISKFGSGGVEIGAKAVSLGMADSVGDFEKLLASLSTPASPKTISTRRTQ